MVVTKGDMVVEKLEKESTLLQILDLLNVAKQAGFELLRLYIEGDYVSAKTLIGDLYAVADAVRTAKEPISEGFEHAYIDEFLENIEYALDKITAFTQIGKIEEAIAKIEYNLYPFLVQIWESFYFWGMVLPNPEKIENYYNNEFALHYQNTYLVEGRPAKYKASVVVVAYNHLDITKRCVESVLKYTDFEKLNAELVLIDHGSTDGTLEYFESLGVGRVIHYKANMRGTSFCMFPRMCDCEYYIHVANDTVVTKDWLEILLKCVESDPNIALAGPATCNICNLQAINVPTSNCEELVAFAENHNKSNPLLWNDRVRVMPVIAAFNARILNKIGFWDPFFYSFDFMDDDFSLRARRNGYRQILCEDVFCYHEGSATVKEEQKKENLLEVGRKLFIKKHGVDPWGNGFCYEQNSVEMMELPEQKSINILGIDCGFGDTILQMCNQLRSKGYQVEKYFITTQEVYIPDLNAQTEHVALHSLENIASKVLEVFSEVSFSVICIGMDLAKYYNPYVLIENLSERMSPKAQLLFFFENPYFAVHISKMVTFTLPEKQISFLVPKKVFEDVKNKFYHVKVRSNIIKVKGIEEFIKRYYGTDTIKDSTKQQLETNKYYIRCTSQ